MIRNTLVFLLAAAAMYAWTSLMLSILGGPGDDEFSLMLYILASLFVFTDLIDLSLRYARVRRRSAWKRPGRGAGLAAATEVQGLIPQGVERSSYAVLYSVHNLGIDVDLFIAETAPFHDRLWVIDDASEDDTFKALREAGIRVVHGIVNRHKPGAIKRLLDHLPDEVETVVVLDPDTLIIDTSRMGIDISLERVLRDFQQSRAGALCPAVRVRRGGWLERFQTIEYGLAFELGRHSLSPVSITSGIAVYRRDALENALHQHSLSIYAEDLENTLHLHNAGESVYYDSRMVVETEVPGKLRDWFSQRVGWSYGLARVYLERWPDFLALGRRSLFCFYNYVIYMGLFTIAFHPVKLLGILVILLSALNALDNAGGLGWIPDTALTATAYAQLVYLKYAALSLIAWALCVKRNSWYALPAVPFYPLYGIAHLLPMTVGFANWLAVHYTGRRIFRDHYASDEAVAHGSLSSGIRPE